MPVCLASFSKYVFGIDRFSVFSQWFLGKIKISNMRSIVERKSLSDVDTRKCLSLSCIYSVMYYHRFYNIHGLYQPFLHPSTLKPMFKITWNIKIIMMQNIWNMFIIISLWYDESVYIYSYKNNMCVVWWMYIVYSYKMICLL